MKAKPNVIYEVGDILDLDSGLYAPVRETRNTTRAQTRNPFYIGSSNVPTYITTPNNDKSGVIIGDPHQRHWELLAYAGPMPDPKDTGLMVWCTLVLQGLSIKYPDSSSQERLDKLVNFADFCRKTHD